MALIKCPECKKKISDQCGKCPSCGYPIEINNQNIETNVSNESSSDNVINKEIESSAPFKKAINKKRIGIICSVLLVLIILGAVVGYFALRPRMNAINKFERQVSVVEDKNKQLDSAIKLSENLLKENHPILNNKLISELEMAISDAKASKETNFKIPDSIEEITMRTEELKKIDYSVVLSKLTEKHENFVIDSRRYQLVDNPTEAYVIQCLKNIPEIVNISAVTEDNDPNGNLNKPGGYTATVFFAVDYIDSKDGETLIEQGTDAGGSIEVYACVEDAIKRRDYLATFDGGLFATGTHTVVGTVLVRTSDEQTASQQKTLESKVITALTYLPDIDNCPPKQNETENEKTPSISIPSETQAPTSTLEPSVTPGNVIESPLSRKEQAVIIAQNNADDITTPNFIKTILIENGFSSDEIQYAVYGGHINWQEYIDQFVYNLKIEAKEIVVTSCTRCHRRFYGAYQSCPYWSCSERVNLSYFSDCSKTETISNLLSEGFLQKDIDIVFQQYEYGEFIDEVDFRDCIIVEGILCDHNWKPATCKNLSTCTYCGETREGYGEHEYIQHQCRYCGKEEPWTPPKISCTEWVSLKELEEKAGYYITTPENSILIGDLNDKRVNFNLIGFPGGYNSVISELNYNGVIVHYRYDRDSNKLYEMVKLNYLDLVSIGVLS